LSRLASTINWTLMVENLEPARNWQIRATLVDQYIVSTIDRRLVPEWVNEVGEYDAGNGRYETAVYHFSDSIFLAAEEPLIRKFSDSVKGSSRQHAKIVRRLDERLHSEPSGLGTRGIYG